MFGEYESFMEASAMYALTTLLVFVLVILAIAAFAATGAAVRVSVSNCFESGLRFKIFGLMQLAAVFLFVYLSIDLINHQFFMEFDTSDMIKEMQASHKKFTYFLFFLVNFVFLSVVFSVAQIIVTAMKDK